MNILRRSGLLLMMLAPLLGAAPAAHAQSRLEAQYTASLAGIPIGKGNWMIEVNESKYSAAASGTTTGLVRFFVGGHATGVATGTLSNGHPVASNYAVTIATKRHTDEVRFAVAAGTIKDIKLEPKQKPDPHRIPVTEEQQRGVMDPMTASLVLMPGAGDMRVPQACDRHLAIFDGKMRYNLKFAFKRMEAVKTDKGYSGPAVVCSVVFEPVAGYDPHRSAIVYLTKPHDMEVWLAPIAGTRVMVPFRAQIETPVGLGVIEATQFVSMAAPVHVTKGLKTQ
jgi:hypothetical protein